MTTPPHAAPGRAVLLTGPLGSGKTSVAVAAGELLDRSRVPHAVIDLDWLCWAGPALPGEVLDLLLAANLAAVARTYRSAGIGSLVLARTVTSLEQVAQLRIAVGGALVAFRLSVPEPELSTRLAVRPGGGTDAAEARLLGASARLHLPAVRNHGRPALDTAREVLVRSGWAPRGS